MDPDLLVALKALSDASRLRIVGVLAEGKPISVEDLASDCRSARARSSITSTACARRGWSSRRRAGRMSTTRCVSSGLSEIGGDLSRTGARPGRRHGPVGRAGVGERRGGEGPAFVLRERPADEHPRPALEAPRDPSSACRHGFREEAPLPGKGSQPASWRAATRIRRRCAAISSTRASWRARAANTDFDRAPIGHVASASRRRLSARARARALIRPEPEPHRAPRHSPPALLPS